MGTDLSERGSWLVLNLEPYTIRICLKDLDNDKPYMNEERTFSNVVRGIAKELLQYS